MAARGRGARRSRSGTPAWIWLLSGILIGLGLAWYLFAKGYIPQPRAALTETAESAGQADSAAGEDPVVAKVNGEPIRVQDPVTSCRSGRSARWPMQNR